MSSLLSSDSLAQLLGEGRVFVAVAISFVAGFLTALSPCVYPLIPITLSVIGARRYESALQGFVVSLFYVAGMVTLYVGLGILFSSLGMLFGTVFRHPIVLLGVGVLFLFFALSMVGALNWLLPTSTMNRLASLGGSGLKGAFLMGLVSGLIASPCTGPVLAFILTLISQTGDMATGSALMLSFGIGMGVPFLILGTFSSVLARIPKSGAWMNRIKIVFGVVMVATSVYFLKLGFDGMRAKKSDTSEIAQKESALLWTKIGQEQNAFSNLQAAIDEAKAAGQIVMIDFYADWCVACKELEKLTFADRDVAAVLEKFKLIRVDLTSETEALKQIESKYGIVGLPLLVFFSAKGEMLEGLNVFGFMPNHEFLLHLKKVTDRG